MQLLASPIMWIGLLLVFFMNRNSKPKGTDLSIFNSGEIGSNGIGTVTSSNGTQISGVTITLARANSIAGLLFEELDEYFTSETDVLDILKGLNEKDFMLVYDQFGKRKQDLLVTTGSYILGRDMNLMQWINQAVTSTKNRVKLNNQFPNIF